MYLTTTISISLVLFMVGLEAVLLLSAHQILKQVKQSVTVTVVLTEKVSDAEVTRLQDLLENAPYCHDVTFVSSEEALQEHIARLGEDPQQFLGYNPLTASFEMHLNASYAQKDSIAAIAEQLEQLPYIDKIEHPQEVIRMLDLHVGQFSLVLLAIALVLLFISVALIVNTVRLHVYSKRFLINTMRLVGATSWVIRAPFVRRNVLMGFEAGLIAIAVLAGAVFYAHERLGVWLFELNMVNVGFVVLLVLLGGQVITFIASLIATGKYIRMKTDKMYEI